MSRFGIQSLLVCAALFGLAACSEPEDSGRVESHSRDVAPFEAIDMEGSAHLEILVGEAHSLVIEATPAVAERVKVEVQDGTLFIESRPKDWLPSNGRPRVTLRISTPTLAALRLGGGNDANIRGFSGGETKIRAEGAAHIKARGELDRLIVHLSGAANAELSKLYATHAKVTVDGVGNVVVHPKQSLDATMNGVGAIQYLGNPSNVSTRMNGFGSIAKQDGPTEEGGDKEDRPAPDPEHLQPEYEDPKRDVAVEKEVV